MNRVYKQEDYIDHLNRAFIAKLHCPYCYSNDISNTATASNKVLIPASKITDYFCGNCKTKISGLKDLLNKEEVRNKKIDTILK